MRALLGRKYPRDRRQTCCVTPSGKPEKPAIFCWGSGSTGVCVAVAMKPTKAHNRRLFPQVHRSMFPVNAVWSVSRSAGGASARTAFTPLLLPRNSIPASASWISLPTIRCLPKTNAAQPARLPPQRHRPRWLQQEQRRQGHGPRRRQGMAADHERTLQNPPNHIRRGVEAAGDA